MASNYARGRGLEYRAKAMLEALGYAEAPEREAESVLACMQRVMEGAMQLDVPLKADGGIGHDWFEA